MTTIEEIAELTDGAAGPAAEISEFRVRWEMDIQASSPLEAIELARAAFARIDRADHHSASVFDVAPKAPGGEPGDFTTHDLAEILCDQGLHSWADQCGKLDPHTCCAHCGEPYGDPS